MENKEIEKFFEYLLNDESAKEYLAEKRPQTLEDLALASGGLAEKKGYRLSKDAILAHLNERLGLIRERSDSTAEGLAALNESGMEAVSGGQTRPDYGPNGPYPLPPCEMPQLAEILKKMKQYGN